MPKRKKIMSKKAGQVYKKVGHRILETIMELFFEYPSSQFSVREIEKKTKIKKSTVQYNLEILKAEGIVSKENKFLNTYQTRLKKIHYYIEKIEKSGVIDFLEKELAASTIILFGSFRKGESVKESDIDLFVEAPKTKHLSLTKFEDKLGHNIQLFIEPKITNLQPHLLNNIVNGIKLRGHFKVK